MEDDIKNIYWKMEDDLNFKEIKDDLNLLVHGRCPQRFFKLKTTSVSCYVMLAQLASSELGSAQPKLVSWFSGFLQASAAIF